MERNDTSFGRRVRAARIAAGLTQQSLAAAAGIPKATIVSWETGRRWPRDSAVIRRLGSALGLGMAPLDTFLASAGQGPEHRGLLKRMEEHRKPLTTTAGWVQSYPWPCMAINERREIIAWNAASNAVAETELGSRLPNPEDRNLLWMAATPWFKERLTNWPELIGRLISSLKMDGHTNPDALTTAWMMALVGRIAAEYPEVMMEIGALFASAQPWLDGERNLHRVEWTVSSGERLAFACAFREWSVFDGIFVMDWHPSNGQTWEWLSGQPPTPPRDTAPPLLPWPETLRRARSGVSLTRKQLQERTRIPAATIYAYETGRRRPPRETLLRLGRALSLPASELNQCLNALAYAGEPSDFARFLLGEPPALGQMAWKPAMAPDSYQRSLATVDDLPWPALILGPRCEVLAGNGPMRRLIDWTTLETVQGHEGPHLLQLLLSDGFRAGCLNWDEVMDDIVPGAIVALVQGRTEGGSRLPFGRVVHHLRRHNADALSAMERIWDARETAEQPPRIATTLRYRTPVGDELAFHCLIDVASTFYPVSSVDLHPADAATWRWVEAGR